ncbi:LOW QUALITY PROTEIN: E3 ubiquitin-protein ligase Ubr3-like [Choristoneura fumiferana]|uniref:LOW QUALITY PROTEIN: E3 ubiquitin-protein ligase Ubr3-like n=1 Tax=Choristoneura fumiferana TaxID=7141 RepID=UPI003D15B0EA
MPPMKSALLSAMSTALAVPPPREMMRNLSDPDDQNDAGGDAPQIRALELPVMSTALVVPPPREVARNLYDSDERNAAGGDSPRSRALESGRSEMELESQALALPMPRGEDAEMPDSLTLALAIDSSPPTSLPTDYDVSSPEWSVSLRDPSPLSAADPQPSNTQVQLHQAADDSIPVNESIISLLLKLHSQLSGRLDSFSLDEPEPQSDEPIGDGPHFIGQVLRKLARLDARCAAAIDHVRHSLWPHQRERQAEQRTRERREKEERSRRARERQQQLMKEFQRRQQQFLHCMQRLSPEPMELDAPAPAPAPAPADYDCVICNTSSVSTPHHPIGRVVLLQSTSVLGHRRRAGSGTASLALSERDRARLAEQRETTAASHYYRLHDDLQQNFDQESWLLSVSVGLEGGVHVASCGHHLHLRCLHAYLRSLAAPARPHNLHVAGGEFLCPVCRQLANSVLPLPPRASVPPAGAADPHEAVADMLRRSHPPLSPSALSDAMNKAMEDMTETASSKLRQRYGSSPGAIFTFVTSLVRTNLECELVQRGGSLLTQEPPAAPQEPRPRYKPRNDCIVPLMVVAGAHAHVLSAAGALGVADTWLQLCPPRGVRFPRAARARAPRARRAPRAAAAEGPAGAAAAPAAAGARAAAPPAAATLCVHSARAVRAQLLPDRVPADSGAERRRAGRPRSARPRPRPRPHGAPPGGQAAQGALAGSDLFEDEPGASEELDVDDMERQVQELLLPYLRVCALLRHHVYGAALPEVTAPTDEFAALAGFLELGGAGGAGALLPPHAPHLALAAARRLSQAARGSRLAVRRILLSLHVPWELPALLRLPRDYDRLFSYYHERVCLQCGAVPKEASVCLLCGTLVCLKQACCRSHQQAEAVQHANDCGGGTGIFLVVTSTYIIVIRGRRACLWGSLYLDDYDEEDRDLKRGKPLYLSGDRAELLQAQWLAHRFDHTKRTWVWHRDSL